MTTSQFRLAVVSTPRAGNTWLSHLLARAWGVPRTAFHLDAADWDALPPSCVLQVHLPATEYWRRELTQRGFRVAVIARHPLDVLLSILHFSRYEPEVLRWLEAEGGEELILGAAPTDPRFHDYALGARATALLNVSRAWALTPDAVVVRYEDLVADTAGELGRVCAEIGRPSCGDLADVVESCALDKLRAGSDNQHFWQGQPGHWRRYLPGRLAKTIAAAHAAVFHHFGYAADADAELTPGQALQNWLAALVPEWRAYTDRRLHLRQENADLWRRLDQAGQAWAGADAAARELGDRVRLLEGRRAA